jgi:HK97 family phage prohead protease
MDRTSHTAEASTIHEPVGKPGGPGLFHHKGLQLPAYIQHVAHHLIASGHDESKAIEMAVGIVKNWAAGHDGHGHRTHPDVQAAAAKAIAEWEADKAKGGNARRSAVTVTQRAEMTTQSINDLPDSDFAYIESGGTKDSSGKTVPRDKRHFPIHDAPHVRDALGRAPQSPFGDKAMPKIREAAKKFGIDADSDDSGSASRYRAEWRGRIYPLEDIHIVRAADERDGRIVEAYATVFEEPAEIHDEQGRYIEVIDRAAFNKVLADVSRSARGIQSVKVMFNHGRNLDGKPSDKYLAPIGVPVDIRPESRGLLTRTRYARTPEAENILSLIEDGAITSQSFTGRIVRSSPELAPGDRYRPRHGQLQTVRRSELGLREYGPVLWPAYSGAEILGVRMTTPGVLEPDSDEVEALPQEEAAAGEPLERAESDEHSARYHQHALYRLRSAEIRERTGLDW